MIHAEENDILHLNQHRFHKHHACRKQLTELVGDIAASLDQGDEIEACVLDFSKAFNKINQKKVLHKLASY